MATSISVLLSWSKRGAQKFCSSPYEWFILTGNRFVLAGVLWAVFMACVVALQRTDIVLVTDATEYLYLFQALVTGNFTLLTIVLAINQLVLSRELKSPGELDTQIETVIDYRNRVTETTGNPTVPSTPTDFLSVLLDGARDTAYQLRSTTADVDDTELAADIDDLVVEITDNIDHISEVLGHSEGGAFSALAVTLETNYSHQLNEALRVQRVYTDDLSSAAQQTLDDLVRSLKQIDIARQYFKSIYIQSELARLSRILLFVGAPAIVSALLLLIIYSSPGESQVAVSYLQIAVPVVVGLGFLPLAVLFSFVLRIATVAQHTAAITPFTTSIQESDFGG